MFDNWTRSKGEGRAQCGPRIAGIPQIAPQWTVHFENHISIDGPVIFGDIIYLNDFGYKLYALDKNTGKLIWKIKEPFAAHTIEAQYAVPFVDQQCVIFWPIIFDRFTGEVVEDLTTHSLFKRAFPGSAAMGRAGNYVYKQVDRKQHKNEYLVYNLETARCYCATLPYDNPLIWYRGENGIIRLENELISVNVLGQHENWRLALPESINEIHSACYYNEIYYFSIKTRLYKIDLSTGDILWVHDAADDDRELVHRNLLGGLAVCHDRCYFFGPGTNKLYALSAETGDMVMETNPISPGVSGVCIAGDLLFALLGEEHAALDRYTGEEVWRLDDQKYNFNPIAVEGQVLLRSFAGYDLISYAWNKDNPYFSRDKPK